MSIFAILFCPNCENYIGSLATTCFCGWKRPIVEHMPQTNQLLWQSNLGGPARGRAVANGDQVLFAWGNRQTSGGVVAFNRQTGEQLWQVKTNYAVEGGLVVLQGKVLFGTLGFLGQDSELHCRNLNDGSLLWKKNISGGVWSTPVVREERVYVGCDNGQVHCFSLRTGEPVSRWPVSLSAGRLWLLLAENSLYAISQQGGIFVIDQYSGSSQEVARLDGEIKTGATFGAGHLFVGTMNGKVYAINPREKMQRILLENCKGVVSIPVLEADILYIGGVDHLLHAIDIQSGREIWKADCIHRIVSSPIVIEGLVFVGSNDGCVYAFDAKDGTTSWRYPVRNKAPVMGSPAYADGAVYIGADNGEVYALPWHLGNYVWGAQKLATNGKYSEAATYFAIASELENHDSNLKEQYCESAMQNWQQVGEHDKSARFRESLLDQNPDVLAREFEEAGKLKQDVSLLRRAAEYYEDADDSKGVKRCNQMAGKLSRAPYLSIHLINLKPYWETGEEGEVVFDIKNRGATPAYNIRIRLAGNLSVRMWAELSGSLSPGESTEVTATIIPTGPGKLLIEPHCTDENGKHWSEMRHFPFEDIKPSSEILKVDGNVGSLILDEHALQKKIRIRGDAGFIHIKSVATEDLRCPHCEKVVDEPDQFCIHCGKQLSPR